MSSPARDPVEETVADWPDRPAELARQMRDKYGPPDQALDRRLVWQGNGPWKRTEVHRDGVPHNFPAEHADHLEQAIDYRVPPEKTGEVIAYDGSLKPERTRGELVSRCEDEAANRLALNLAHDIVTGTKSVDEAREAHARALADLASGDTPAYAEELAFEPVPDQNDPDEEVVTDTLREEVKDLITGPPPEEQD